VTDRTGTADATPLRSPRLCASIVLPSDLWCDRPQPSPQRRLGSLAALSARDNWEIPACAVMTMGQGGDCVSWTGRDKGRGDGTGMDGGYRRRGA